MPEPRRVLLVEPNGMGGHAEYCRSLREILSSRYRVGVLTRKRDGVRWKAEDAVLSRVTRLGLYAGIWNFLRRRGRRYDVIHFQVLNLFMVVVRLLLYLPRRKVRVVYTWHNLVEHRSTPAARFAHAGRLILLRWGLVHGIYLHDTLKPLFEKGVISLPGPRPSFVPHHSFRSYDELCEEYQRCKDGRGVTLLFFGVVRRNKGLKEFLELLLPDSYPLRFRIAGRFVDYPAGDLQKYSAMFDELNIEDRFISPEEKAGYFRWADWCVLPHTSEFVATSGVLIDAYDYGIPVLALRGSALAGEVEAAGTGLVLDPTNADEERRTITARLRDEKLRSELRGVIRREMLERRRPEAICAAYDY